jgi:hypothetical protein
MKKKAAAAKKDNSARNNSKDISEKESLDYLIKNNTDERKSKFLHYIVIVRYALSLFVLLTGIILRYGSQNWRDFSSAMIVVGSLMLFIAAIRLMFKQYLPIGEKALLSEVRSQRLAIAAFFLYVFVMLMSYWLRPANLDLYLVLGYGTALVPVCYLVSYRFLYKTE